MKVEKPSAKVLTEQIFLPHIKTWDVTNGPDPRDVGNDILLNNIFKEIEIVGRMCCYDPYGGADKFVNMLINKNDFSMLEHGAVYLDITQEDDCDVDKYWGNPYTIVDYHDDVSPHVYSISTNYRVIIENKWTEDLQYLCVPGQYHEPRISVYFVCDMITAMNFMKHRAFSFAHEKSNTNNISYVISGLDIQEEDCDCKDLHKRHQSYVGKIVPYTEEMAKLEFLHSLSQSRIHYTNLVSTQGWSYEQSKRVLPLSTKTGLVMTGFQNDWMGGFVNLDKPLKSGFFPIELHNIENIPLMEVLFPLIEEIKKIKKNENS